ncbi:hydrogenase expression/formation protein HypE [Candidatus Omnitrophota bacterium]
MKKAPEKILLAHGSGGRLMHKLIKERLLKKLDNPILRELSDSALINCQGKLAFSTDSYVVSPLDFPGADIGKLAVCGTINDLVMAGAIPQYLSLAFIIEEGLSFATLEKIVDSVSSTAKREGVKVVTGDLKVVEKGACDKLFINTSGIGRIIRSKALSVRNIRVGDRIIISGNIGQHGLAVLARRKELDFKFNIKSDCAALNGMIVPILKKTHSIRFMRDPTRGGLATTLNETVQQSGLGMIIEEEKIPVSSRVRAACELLGLDPLYVANEGRAVLVVEKASSKKILNLLRRHPQGRDAQEIGRITKKYPGQVVLNTSLGTKRIVDMLTGDPLPRIC